MSFPLRHLELLFSFMVPALLAASAARAEWFSQTYIVTSSSLASVVTHSSVYFTNGASVSIDGPQIGGEAFKGTTGVIAVVQNSGINSSVQQAVTINMNSRNPMSFRQ